MKNSNNDQIKGQEKKEEVTNTDPKLQGRKIHMSDAEWDYRFRNFDPTEGTQF